MLNHFRPVRPYVRIFYAECVIAVLWRVLAWLPTGLLVVSIRPAFVIEVVPFWVGRCGGLLSNNVEPI